jgi:uncharacterized membrane protein
MINISNVQSRFRSKVAWMAIIALITFIVKNFLKIEIPNFDEFWTLVMAVLVALGVFNNPTNKDNY